MSSEALAAIEAASKYSAAAWWDNYAHIWPKEGSLTGNTPGAPKRKLELNRMQRDVCAIVQWCRENGEPCRIVGYKGRQTGLSTISVENCYHRMVRKPARACIIGDEYDKSVKNLVTMFETYAAEDKCPWNNPYYAPGKKFANGSELITETANDPRAGAGRTCQVVIATEVAHWPETGVRSAKQTFAALLNCVPKLPDTLVIVESTANGAQGIFYETFQGAVTFEEFKAGKRGNGFIKVFYAWHEHDDYKTSLTDLEAADIMRTLTQKEEDLIKAHGLGPERLKWRRDIIASPNFSGNEDLFDQEYPPDPQSGFLSSGRMAFPAVALDAMEREGRKYNVTTGVLDTRGEGGEKRTSFRPVPDNEAWLDLYERPMEGRRYIIGADVATGSERATGEGADSHAPAVIRAGQFLDGKGWVPPMVVAHLRSTEHRPCRVPIDVLAEWLDALSRYYGGAPVAFEVNNPGLALYQCLKVLGTPIYEREVTYFKEGVNEKKPGWVTDDKTRIWLVNELQAHIRMAGREGFGLIIPAKDILDQFRKFIINAKGRYEAARGSHDDWVFGVGIGVVLQDFAKLYVRRSDPRPLPPDIRAMLAQQEARRPSGGGRRAYS